MTAPFEVQGYKVKTERSRLKGTQVQAIVEVRVGGEYVRRSGTGEGPVHALDAALRACLIEHHPSLANVELADYRVSMVNSEGTASKVRVMVEATDGVGRWDAGCTSPNIIDASFEALSAVAILGILRERETRRSA